MKILIFGSSGTLGVQLQKLNADIICPTHEECDITKFHDVMGCILDNKPDVVINAAGIIDNRSIEKDPNNAIETNIIGAANVAMVCLEYNIRCVYISTDYLYEGDRGNYREEDPLKPFNLYAWSKLGGECSTVAVKNHLIIRTSFGKNTFDYKDAFTDKWSSKCYVDEIAPMILEAAMSPLTGVLNLGTERKTLFDHASQRSEVKPVKIADTNYHTPYDTSLNLQKWMDYKSEKSIAKPHTKCRCCGSDKLVKYLDLGLMPLANNLEYTAKLAKAKDRFPLQVLFCEECYLSQLSVVIDPEVLFSYYTYRSGVSQGYLDHCKEMAKQLDRAHDIHENVFHIDIAGNDGALLMEFKHQLQLTKVLNVDPASNLCSIAERNGIESVCEFWSSELASKLVNSHGKADLITATNVFAHLDDIRDFMLGCKTILADDGIIVIENPYLTEFIDNMEYCQTYFEHVSYLSLSPVMRLCDDLGLKVIDAIHVPIHSGSMRYIISHKESIHEKHSRVTETLALEYLHGYDDLGFYEEYQSKVNAINTTFTSGLLSLKKQGYSIVGFGASAKGSTLLNYAGINTDIMDAILDDTPEKQGKFSPGTGIPIYARNYLKSHKVDYVVILAWNFHIEIINKLREYGYEGKFIIPAPVFQIID